MPPEKTEEMTRGQIAAFLPRALATAIASYDLFLGQTDMNDPQKFKAHHDACKVALAHIELLLKLAQWAEVAEDCEDPDEKLAALLAAGQAEVERSESLT